MLEILGLDVEEIKILENLKELNGEIYKENDLIYYDDQSGMNPFTIDFLKGEFIFRLKTNGKKQPLLKSVDIAKNRRILDATAGLGRDALTMAFHGCHVLAIEKNPLLYLMLKSSYEKLKKDPLFAYFKGTVEFVYADSFVFIEKSSDVWDVIYLDPMYPTEEKSSKSKKDIQFLKKIAETTDNLEQLLILAMSKASNRVVLKRPPKSEKIISTSLSFDSQLVRFDVYIKGSIQ